MPLPLTRPLKSGLVLLAEGFESEFLLKRYCWNRFENAVTKTRTTCWGGCKKASLQQDSLMVLSHLTFKAILKVSQLIFHTTSSCILTTYYFWPSQHFSSINSLVLTISLWGKQVNIIIPLFNWAKEVLCNSFAWGHRVFFLFLISQHQGRAIRSWPFLAPSLGLGSLNHTFTDINDLLWSMSRR